MQGEEITMRLASRETMLVQASPETTSEANVQQIEIRKDQSTTKYHKTQTPIDRMWLAVKKSTLMSLHCNERRPASTRSIEPPEDDAPSKTRTPAEIGGGRSNDMRAALEDASMPPLKAKPACITEAASPTRHRKKKEKRPPCVRNGQGRELVF